MGRRHLPAVRLGRIVTGRYRVTLAGGRRRHRLAFGLPLLASAALGACASPRGDTGAAPGGATAAVAAVAPPSLIVMRADALERARRLVAARDSSVMPAYEELLDDAGDALAAPLVAVTDKRRLLPPSNDPHDYFSLSPYWWPDPAKADGLPYIRRDGETNPESKRDLDQPRVATLGSRVRILALAWYLTGDERYARRGAEQLRTWFLDPATRMNPHLRFAQLVRGIDRERGSGIIDTRWFIEVVDAASLLRGSAAWTDADQAGLRAWMRDYLTWLRTSPNGAHEQRARNNHGSWFAAQTAALALYAGDTALTREIVEGARARIGAQIQPDGTQPIELERTRSFHYAGFNLEALTRLAEIGRKVGVDLWSHQAPEGGSLRRAIDHVARYLPEPATWPGRQITAIEPENFLMVLRRARVAYGEPAYAEVLARMPQGDVRRDVSALIYP